MYQTTAILLTFWGLELHARYDQKVMAPNTQSGLFPVRHFVCKHTHNSKTTHPLWPFYIYQMTEIISEMSIFLIRAACEIQWLSYGFKHTSQSLSPTPFVRTYMHNLRTTGCI